MEFRKLNKNIPILDIQRQSENVVVYNIYVVYTLYIY